MNVYFICVIVRVQMWCVCAQPYVDQTKRFFYHFICIWKCFSSLFVPRFCTYFVFQCFKLVFVLKNRDQSLSWVIRDLAASCETKKCIFSIFGHQIETFVSVSRVTHKKGLPAKYPRKFPTICENFQISYFMGISWVLVKKLFICLYYDSILSKPSFSKLLHQNPTNFNCFTLHKHL